MSRFIFSSSPVSASSSAIGSNFEGALTEKVRRGWEWLVDPLSSKIKSHSHESQCVKRYCNRKLGDIII